jgi:hypothetical protein
MHLYKENWYKIGIIRKYFQYESNSISYIFPPFKDMYNGREDILSFNPPYHLKKAIDISSTMHYLLSSYLTISDNYFLVRN